MGLGVGRSPPPGTGRQRVGSPECVKRDANSLIADGVPKSWDQREGECTPGARPQHSPSSEEKEAEVSMALWKFSSIFRPSSMLGPGRGGPAERKDASGVCASGTRRPQPPHSWERTEGASGVSERAEGVESKRDERGVGGVRRVLANRSD